MDPASLPGWARRALDPSTPMSEARETVKTYSYDNRLFPLIRMIDGKLVDMQDDPGKAYDMAIEMNDYIQFENDADATAFSKRLSNMIGKKRSVMSSMAEGM